jgi:subtilisin family serine protease
MMDAMRRIGTPLFVLALLLLGSLASVADAAAVPDHRSAGTVAVWVYFRDKGPQPEARHSEAQARLTPRALARRALRGRAPVVGVRDVPLARDYVAGVASRVTRVRHEVAWLNAMSVDATEAQQAALSALPYVSRVERVRGYRGREEEGMHGRAQARTAGPPAPRSSAARSSLLDYGFSAGQVGLIRVPELHDQDLHGEGVIVAVFDTGFNNLAHEAFATTAIVARHDFVNNDDDVSDGQDKGEGSHGTETLSVIGGYAPGRLIGPAFAASFILAKTENTDSETPVEEDNWAAAAEWAESLGADVISSSLGYLTYDPPFPSYTFAQMDGVTAISTRAAEVAASHGVVVVNSAGNSGQDVHNTLGAPADGAHVITAGATTSTGTRASFSSVGPTTDGRIKPDVAAQGVGVIAASPFSVSGYTGVSGTSFSCPLTAGVAALLVQARPTATVDEIAQALRSTASQAGAPDNLLGFGIVNAVGARDALVALP